MARIDFISRVHTQVYLHGDRLSLLKTSNILLYIKQEWNRSDVLLQLTTNLTQYNIHFIQKGKLKQSDHNHFWDSEAEILHGRRFWVHICKNIDG